MRDRKKDVIIVDGFCFQIESEAKQAKKEQEGVKYIKGKTDMDNPEMVLQIYNKMIEQQLFETAVGYSYLKELQEYLRAIPFIKNEDIQPIPVSHPSLEEGLKKAEEQQLKIQKEFKKNQQKKEKSRRRETAVTVGGKAGEHLKLSLLLNAVLAVCIVAMFVISMTSGSPTIINYESEIINKYELWEQELEERETVVREKEQELNIQEETE